MSNNAINTNTNTIPFDPHIYDEAKEQLKQKIAELHDEKLKYPTSVNQLSEKFIVDYFVDILSDEHFDWVVSKRDECRAKVETKEGADKAETTNWFPAFRGAVGKRFFPEFNSANKTKDDKFGDVLRKKREERRAKALAQEGGEN